MSETKFKFYVKGVDIFRLIDLIKCIEEIKPKSLIEITDKCNASWKLLYTYLDKATKWGLIETDYGRGKEFKITIKPKFHEFVETVKQSIEILNDP
ncbi:MAG: hypothetical protein B6U89_03600 [Desulfurococcales archaeon ex4484_58]|nr:MAG: hypothetical protein B6U89_03600 [Desulfurococcales archaeon ex4484_58]